MNTFYTEEELSTLGIKQYGKHVLIGKNVMIYNPEKLVLGNDVRIDDFCVLSGNIVLGNNIHISHFCGLYGGDKGIWMEDFSGLSSKVTVYAVSDDYTGRSMTNPMVPAEYKPYAYSAKVCIEKHGIVGAGSIILPGVVVQEGTSIGAMSLVTKTTDPWGVYVGTPAKKMKERSRELLELEKQYLEKTQA